MLAFVVPTQETAGSERCESAEARGGCDCHCGCDVDCGCVCGSHCRCGCGPDDESAGAVGGSVCRCGCQPRKMRGRAIVGGLEFAVGGWGEYEADRRVALSALGSRPGANYPGRSTLRPGDAIQSLVAGGGADSHFDRPRNRALTRAARRLQAALGRLEDELCSLSEDGVWECAGPREPTLTIPPLTSSDLRAFLEDPAQQTDPEALSELGAAAGIVAASLGEVLPPLPPPPDEVAEPEAAIPVEDDEAVLRLEASVLPRVRGLEELQARVATRLDRVAEAVEKRPASAN